ncbi:MAG: N-acetylmuramoyl-L-alanine amidase [Cyanobacteria bacterium REEB67]|nr:N-acetylmuramoyl-L-alanine amidase [Cyanobacteria bacterium REEB67]
MSKLPNFSVAPVLALALTFVLGGLDSAWARHKHSTSSHVVSHGGSHSSAHGSSSRSSRHGHSAAPIASSGRHHKGHEVAHHGRHHKRHEVAHQAPRTRYAYPLGLFMKSPPPFDSSPLSPESAASVARAFERGTADSYPARTLVRAGVVHYHPLHGGIFWRREPIKYIVMHSTETGVPISAVRVIESWTSMGMRHPGAQYVVERDGTIYQAVDPDLATVHVNIFKTLPGINNDNSIGIEMNHTGSQDYPQVMRDSVIKLVGYLKHRYNIDEGNIITHRYAQQGDHTDPVHFDWDGFLAQVNTFHNQAIAYRNSRTASDAQRWQREPEPKANTYLKPHKELGKNSRPDLTPPAERPVVPEGENTTDIRTMPEEVRESLGVKANQVATPSTYDAQENGWPVPGSAPAQVPAPAPGARRETKPPAAPVIESPVPEASEADIDASNMAPTKMKVYPPRGEAYPPKAPVKAPVKATPDDQSSDAARNEKQHSDPNFEPMDPSADPKFEPGAEK